MKTILISGNFNILHTGHIRLLKFAKELGDKLIVAVNSDKLGGEDVHVPEEFRLEGVASNKYVTEAFLLNDPIEKIIKKIKPDIVVKGKEHEFLENKEYKELKKYGGKLIFSSGDVSFSSVNLIKKESTLSGQPVFSLPKQFCNRHEINNHKLFTLIESFKSLNVCVIGDLILDEYITCEPLGMSQEDPTIVVNPIDSSMFIGGSGIVASHASKMGANTSLITVTGKDKYLTWAKRRLKNNKVDAEFFIDDSRHTSLKQRYRSKGKTLMRVSQLSQHSINQQIQTAIIKSIRKKIKNIDLIIFSDFNYGSLPQQLVEEVTSLAKSNNVFIAADSQSSSQTGDISRFKDMDLITPTEREARIALKDNESGLVTIAEKISKISRSKNLLLKLGEDGLLIYRTFEKTNAFKGATDRISALNEFPLDAAGAGDSLLITSAMALRSGGSIWEAGLLGSIVAAIQVSRIGNTPITYKEIIRSISKAN